jgi:hypothetical protein
LRIKALLSVIVALSTIAGPLPSWGTDTFIVPGLALEEARFDVGAWCRYLVIDEAWGEKDSTIVYLAVSGRQQTVDGEAFWIELESGPWGSTEAERETVSALVSAGIKNAAPGDSLYHYVHAAYIRKGTGVIETADPASIKRLSLSNPTSDSAWTLVRDVAVVVPSGTFLCERKHVSVEDNREVPMGRVKLIKHDEDKYDLWFADEVPIFHLVKCVIERVRDTKTVPRISGIPDKGREESRTTAVLLDHGFGAKPLLSVDQ